MNGKRNLSWIMLLISEFSMILFLCWALAVEARKQEQQESTTGQVYNQGVTNEQHKILGNPR